MTHLSITQRAFALVAAIALVAGLAVAPRESAAQASAPAAVAVAPAAAPAPIADATTTKESVDNPYGLGALWAQGDFVARGTLVILVIMSMGSWYILITKLYESFKITSQAKDARKEIGRAHV